MIAPKTTFEQFNYLRWQELFLKEKPFQLFCDLPVNAKDQRHTNVDFELRSCPVQDIRGRENDFTLDQNGFMFVQQQASFKDFDEPERVKEMLYPEIERLVKENVEQADHAVIFDHRLRRTKPANTEAGRTSAMDLNDLSVSLSPSPYVHCDQSALGAMNKVLHHTKELPPSLLNKRVRIVNVWRPLYEPVEDWPLAVCDVSTLEPDDLVEVDNIRRNLATSALYSVYNPTHKWYYLSAQRPDEIIIHKQFDTANVPAIRCPHCAFQPTDASPTRKYRESIEFRVIVLTNPDTD